MKYGLSYLMHCRMVSYHSLDSHYRLSSYLTTLQRFLFGYTTNIMLWIEIYLFVESCRRPIEMSQRLKPTPIQTKHSCFQGSIVLLGSWIEKYSKWLAKYDYCEFVAFLLRWKQMTERLYSVLFESFVKSGQN